MTQETADIDIPDSQCTHLLALWKDDSARDALLKKYKTVISFGLSRYRNGAPVTKKRKVMYSTFIQLFVSGLNISIMNSWRHLDAHSVIKSL